MEITTYYTYIKTHHEYIPVLSSLTSAIKIFLFVFCDNEDLFIKKHQYRSLKKNSISRSLLLLIPLLGNFFIALYDFKKQQQADFALKIVQLNGLALANLSKKKRDTEKYVRAAIKQDIRALSLASLRLRNNLKFIEEMVFENRSIFGFAGDTIRKDSNFIFDKMINYDLSILKYAHNDIQRDENFMISAMEIDRGALKNSKILRKNEAFIKKVANLKKFNEDFLLLAHKTLRKKQSFIKELIQIDLNFLKIAHMDLRMNEGFIREEMIKNPKILIFSPLRSNPDFVAKMMKINLSFLEFADDSIRKDKAFLNQFPQEEFKVLQYAHISLRRDPSYIREMVLQNKLSLRWLDKTCKRTFEIVLLFVEYGGIEELQWASSLLKKNRQLAKSCITLNPKALLFFDESINTNVPNLLELVEINPEVINFIIKKIQAQEEFFEACVIKNLKSMQFCPFVNELEKYTSFVLKMIEKHPIIMNCVAKSLRDNYIFIRKAMYINFEILKYCNKTVRNDSNLFFEVMLKNPANLEFAHPSLKANAAFILKFIKKDSTFWSNYNIELNFNAIRPYIDASLMHDKIFTDEMKKLDLLDDLTNYFLYRNNDKL